MTTTTMTAAAKALEVKKAGLWACYLQQKAVLNVHCRSGVGNLCGQEAAIALWCYNNADNPLMGYLNRQQVAALMQRMFLADPVFLQNAIRQRPQPWDMYVAANGQTTIPPNNRYFWGAPYIIGHYTEYAPILADPTLPIPCPRTSPDLFAPCIMRPRSPQAQALYNELEALHVNYLKTHTPPGPSFWVSLRNNFEAAIVTGGEMIAAAFVIAYAAGAAYSALAAGGTTASATTAAATTATSGGAMTPIAATATTAATSGAATTAATTAVAAGSSTGLEATAAAAMGYAKQAYGVYSAVKAIQSQRSVSKAEQAAAQQAAQQAAAQQAVQGQPAVSLAAAQKAAQKSVVSPLEPLVAIGVAVAAKLML
ncbi:MAG: hypothetical protein ACYCVW_16480 [Rhodocyclaceae bacterium]